MKPRTRQADHQDDQSNTTTISRQATPGFDQEEQHASI
jgi:hypothetical protein